MGNGAITGGVAAGQGLGNAHATITLDTSQLASARQVARQVGQDVAKSFDVVKRATDEYNQSLQRYQATVAQVLSQGGIGQVISDKGVRQAQRELNAASSTLRNVQREAKGADTAIKGLDASTSNAGVSVGKLVQGFIGLGTVWAAIRLNKAVVEMAEVAAQADRVHGAFNNLAAGAGQSGDAMLNAMRKASRGMIADSDLILAANRALLLNVANTADEMAQLVEAARVRGQAMGLSTTQAFNDLVTGIGRLSPLILDNLGIITDAENTFTRYAEQLGRTAESLTDAEKRQALLNRVISETRPMLEAAGRAVDSNADKFERAQAAADNARKALGRVFGDEVAQAAQEYADVLTQIAELLERIKNSRTPQGEMELKFKQFGLPEGNPQGTLLRSQITNLELMRRGLLDAVRQIEADRGTQFFDAAKLTELNGKLAGVERELSTLGRELSALHARQALSSGLAQRMGAGFADIARPAIRGATIIDDPNAGARRTAILDFQREIAGIERSAASARLDATRSYERQRSEIIANYERTVAREAEDFGRQRARAEAQFAQQIADMQRDAARREARWIEDLAERIGELQTESGRRIAEAQEDANKRIAEVERDYQRNRERAERDHRDRLFDAAARLDASAVAAEQRNFRRQQQDAEEAHQEQISDLREKLAERIEDEQENLQRRIDQENRAHEKRLQDAREADAERLADMRRDFEERKRQEDEDRAIRLQRMAADHQAQLAEMERAQAERIAQINRHEAEERKAAEDAHLAEMQKLGGTVAKGWKLIQDAIEKAMLESYDEFKRDLEQRYGIQGPAPRPPDWNPTQFPTNVFQSGGVTRTGASITMASGAIQVFASPGMSPEDVARAVRGEVVDIFKRLQ